MMEDPPQDPPPLPRLPPDPVFLGPDAGLRGSLLSSPSSSPMDLSPAVSVLDSTDPDKNLASSGPSPPLTGSFIFGSLSPSVPLPSVLSDDTTRTGEEPEKDSKIGSSLPLSSDGSDGSEVGGTSGACSTSEGGTLALGFPLRPSSVTGSTIQQSQSKPPSSSLVLSTGTGLNSTVFLAHLLNLHGEEKEEA
ncbi:unnamed protein product [Brassica napus]|uniref:(rape) hypothetical protein n=1 Tax=Brassica napus TaxID=3708 RepID=A0A817ARU3_BRANA|nr:unnamed protein product [Brassica napus]